MKKLIFLFFLVYGIAVSAECQNKWKGKILTENGIKVIHNPKTSLYGKMDLKLEENLRIGDTNNAEDLLWIIKDIALDQEGNIYVVELKNYRLRKFDRNGKALQIIGRFGQAPGEFQLPLMVGVSKDSNRIYVCDYIKTIVVFDKQGSFEKTIRLEGSVYDFIPVGDGKLISVLSKNHQRVLCEIDEQGKIVRTIASFPYHLLMAGNTVSGSGLETDLYFSKLNHQSFVYGYSKEYKLMVIDADYKMKFIIKKDAPNPELTPEEEAILEDLKKRGFAPDKNKPYFFSILTDSQGRIYVQRNQAMTIMRGRGPIDVYEKEVDVFSRDGYFLFTTKLPANTKIIQDGYLYLYDIDEEQGMEYVKRFKIENWDKLPVSYVKND